MPKKYTKDDFVKQLSIEHPNLELLGEYNGNKEYLTVKCTKHDYVFQTKPNWLHVGHGCKKCYDEKRIKTTDKFINDARKIHGDKYDYSKVEYVNSRTKVCIICKKHGEFWQTPIKHLNGRGCSKCSSEINGLKKRLTFNVFVERAKNIHGDKYTYFEDTFQTSEQPTKMLCPIHGEFWQKPYYHTNGCGCPKCNESHLERTVRHILEQFNIEYIYQANKTIVADLNKQTLDFYLPKYNIAIECQGEQHFKPIKFWNNENSFQLIIERDLKKNEILKNNNIKIWYVVDDNVTIEILNHHLYNENNTIKIVDFLKKIEKINDSSNNI